MATNRRKLKNAISKWDQLHDAGDFSLPEKLGTTAIICSMLDDSKEDQLLGMHSIHKSRKELKLFRNEALALADRISRMGELAEVVINASANDFKTILRDPTYSSIQVIGHGNLAALFIKGEKDQDYFDWNDVSRETDHLKQGVFTQRTCGNIVRNYSVPLGTFAMSDHSRIIAPVACEFSPRGLDHPQCNDLLVPVTDRPRMDFAYIKNTFV